MSNSLTKSDFAAKISAAKQKIEDHLEELNKLDAATGDGDHGTSIIRVIQAADTAARKEASFKDMLTNVGMAVMSVGVGSAGPLIGSFFMGMGDAVDSEELDASQVAAMFEAGVAGMQKYSKAQVGDKTMMDAILPAVAAMDGKSEIPVLFSAAAEAAASGAEATREMTAKFGRARNLGERTKGHLDAGARSFSLIFAAFAEA
jgi:phosphoenolpyruvate---glycerone phosphotransferase subunit DhaL